MGLKVIVSCGSKKKEHGDRAYKLYSGLYFRSLFSYAESIVPLTDIYILSAKYGLISALKYIEPYDSRMGSKTQEISKRVFLDQKQILKSDDVIFLGGSSYSSFLRDCGVEFLDVLKGRGGMGSQMSYLSSIRGTVPK